MTSSTKPEVRNVLQRRQRRTQRRSQATFTENLVRCVVSETGGQTDRHTDTDTVITIIRTHTEADQQYTNWHLFTQ